VKRNLLEKKQFHSPKKIDSVAQNFFARSFGHTRLDGGDKRKVLKMFAG